MNKSTYAWLAIGAGVVIAISWWLRGTWLSGLALNLGAGILTILITVLFVERILRNQQERDRLRIARGALRKTGESLQQIVRAFSNLLKGSLNTIPSLPPKTVGELFSGGLVESLSRCDLGSTQPAPTANGWAEYMNNALYTSMAGIVAAIGMYAVFLPAAYVELLDELHDHIYIAYVRSMYPYIEHERGREGVKRFPLDGRPEDRRTFFRTLVKAVELHNTLAESPVEVPLSFASESYAPDVGSLRIDAASQPPRPSLEQTASSTGVSDPPKALPVPRIRLLDP